METSIAPTNHAGITALNIWAVEIGISPITAWRFRNRGWLKTTNIAGRVYVTRAQQEEFVRRAEAGEFAMEHKAPGRKAAA